MPGVTRALVACAVALTGLLPVPAHAGDDWQDMVFISGTVGNQTSRLCMGVPADKRPSDIGCPAYAPSLSTAGHVSITGNVSANRFIGDGSGLTNLNVQGDRMVSGTHAAVINESTGYVSLTTGGGTWGYLSSGWSYLANLFSNSISSTLVSATNVSATYLDATRTGTVSGTYGYFRYISGTDIHGRFTGDGSGLTGVIASSGDRIVSGSTGGTRMVAISDTGYISITQAGANSGWFDPYRGLVTLGVSATGPISGTAGYFSGKVGIGLSNPTAKLEIAGGYVRVSRSETNSQPAFFEASASGGEQLTWKYVEDAVASIPADVWQFRSGGSASSNIVFSRFDSVPVLYLVTSDTSGRVGVGTTSPLAKLDVAGTISASDAIQVGGSSLACSSGIAGALRYAGGNIQYCNGTAWGSLVGAADAMGDRIVSGSTNAIAWQDRSLTISTAGSQRMIVGENGNVGIGTSTPGTAMLSVAHSYPTIRLADIDAGSLGSVSGRVEFTDDNGNIAGVVGPQGNSAELVLRNLSGGRVVLVPGSTPVLSALNNGRVGIGWNVITPTATLQVSGSFIVSTSVQNTTPSLYVTPMGQVLVASDSALPGVKLHVGGILTARDNAGGDARILTYSGNGSIITQLFSYDGLGGYVGTHSNHPFRIRVNDTDRMVVSTSGNVGIGQAIPLAKLDVGGTISASNAVQVGSSSLACSAGIPGAIRYNGGTLQYCNGTTWTTLGAAGGGLEDRIVSGTTNAIAWQDRSLTISTAGTQRMIVGENGNVGIGTSAPAYSLDVKSLGGTILRVQGENNAPAALINLTDNTGGATWNIENGRVSGSLGFYLAGTLGGPVAADRTKLIINSSGRVGINTLSPTATLQVSGSFTVSSTVTDQSPSLYVGTDGRVGIGTPTPSAMLTLDKGALDAPRLQFRYVGQVTSHNVGVEFKRSGAFKAGLFVRQDNDTLSLWAGAHPRLSVLDGGNVGISTTTPLAKLDVAGTISASDAIQVGTSSLSCSGGIPGAIRYNGGSLQYCNGTAWTTLGTSAGVTGTGSATAVAFWSGPSALTYSDGFYWDNAGKRLGVGTNVPGASVEVSSTEGLRLTRTGGTNAPWISWYLNATRQAYMGYGTPGTYFQLQMENGNNFYIGGGNVGIKTHLPTATLQVSGSFIVSSTATNGMPALSVASSGTVGIGALNTSLPLLVSGTSGFYPFGSGSTPSLRIRGDSSYLGVPQVIRFRQSDVQAGAIAFTFFDNPSTTFAIRQYPGSILRIGIGTISPTASVDVVGTISASDAIQVGQSSLACSGGIPGAIRYNAGALELCNGTSWGALGGEPALGDRIISGTLAMVANSATSYVSLSTNGTTWGYLGSTNSYLPTLSANRVSATNVSGSIIQVGNTGASCTSGISGAIRYSADRLEYCNGNTWTSTGPSDTIVTGRVVRSATQSIANATWTDVTFDGEMWDTAGMVDISGQPERITIAPGQQGYYLVVGKIVYATHATGARWMAITLNGAQETTCNGMSGSMGGYYQESCANVMYLSAGVYLGLQTYQNRGGALDLLGAHLSATKLSPGGGGGGGGASVLNDLSDVNTSGLATGSILAYNGSNWVVSSTGTGTAEGDRITSGTHAVTVNTSSGYVSLSTSGTDWGYFGNVLSYLPALHANRLGVGISPSDSNAIGKLTVYDSGLAYAAPALTGSTDPAVLVRNIFGSVAQDYGVIQTGTTWVQNRLASDFSYRFSYLINPNGGNVGIGLITPTATLTVSGTISASDAIQVGTSSLACSSGIPGAIRYNGGNLQYCNGSAWTTLGTSGGGPEDRITSGTHVVMVNTGTGYTSLSTGGTTWGYLGNNASFLPTFLANRVGIGTTSPLAKLDVAGHVLLSGPTSNTIAWGTTGAAAPGAGSAGMKLQLYGATPNTMATSDYALGIESSNIWFNTGGGFKWYTAAVQRMTLDSSGNLTAAAFLYSSDRRLKENIVPLSGGLSSLEGITPVTFSFISDTAHTPRLGVIAQEVEKVYPQAVSTGEDGYKRVDYPALVPVLIQSVKELKAANDSLTERAVLFERINDGLRRWNHQLRDDVEALKAANGNLERRLEALEAGKANAR